MNEPTSNEHISDIEKPKLASSSDENIPGVGDTFIFTFSRMNPPHPGHLKLIKNMIYKAIELNVQKVFVFLSKTKNDINPLFCNSENENEKQIIYKSGILRQMITSYKQQLISEESLPENKLKIENIEIIVECKANVSLLNTPMIDFKETRPTINTFMVVGSDRESFIQTFSKMFEKMDFINIMDGMVLQRDENAGEFDINNIATYSASKIREIVKNGDKDTFEKIYNQYLDNSTINTLFDSIQTELAKSSAPKTKKRKLDAKSPTTTATTTSPSSTSSSSTSSATKSSTHNLKRKEKRRIFREADTSPISRKEKRNMFREADTSPRSRKQKIRYGGNLTRKEKRKMFREADTSPRSRKQKIRYKGNLSKKKALTKRKAIQNKKRRK